MICRMLCGAYSANLGSLEPKTRHRLRTDDLLAGRKFHEYLPIDQVGMNTRLQPIEKLLGGPQAPRLINRSWNHSRHGRSLTTVKTASMPVIPHPRSAAYNPERFAASFCQANSRRLPIEPGWSMKPKP